MLTEEQYLRGERDEYFFPQSAHSSVLTVFGPSSSASETHFAALPVEIVSACPACGKDVSWKYQYGHPVNIDCNCQGRTLWR